MAHIKKIRTKKIQKNISKSFQGAYEEPKYLPGGDKYLLVEFGNVMNLELNFKAQGLAKAVEESKLKGVYETLPCFASMIVHYNSDDIKFNDLKNELKQLVGQLKSSDDVVVQSRLFRFPTVYLDKWTKEAIDDYTSKIAPKQSDPEYIVDLNDLDDVDHFVRVHSGPEYWVASLGFWPGLPFNMPLDPRCKLSAPKYNPPRTWTPRGTVGMGVPPLPSTQIVCQGDIRFLVELLFLFGILKKDFPLLKIVFVSLDQVIVLNLTLALMKSLMKSKEK